MNLYKLFHENQLSADGKAAFEQLLKAEPRIEAEYNEYKRRQEKRHFLHRGPHPMLHVGIFLLLVAICAVIYILMYFK